ncbi:MAG: translation initiation factor IF-2 [Pseudomonadota bacterium]|nr:translation initiation factor IF-2 [Pseudomonadota bacterium]MEE2820736.1 translation initiation factor IF-2 [Pseudomonadota bacterium]
MSDTTVKQLATLVGISAEQLLSQMVGAGIDKSSSDDVVTNDEKQKLLAHIRSGQAKVSAEPAKVTLRRKSTSTIKAGAGAVNVEVRKKRTYVHRDLTAEAEKQREIEDAKVRGMQEAVGRAHREAEAAVRAVETEVSPEALVAEESASSVEEALIAVPIVEPPPPPKEDDGRRHKKETHARRDRPNDDDEPRRHGKPSGKRDDKRGKIDATDDERGPKMRGRRKPGKAAEELSSHKFEKPAAPIIREVKISGPVTVAELANQMAVKSGELIKILMKIGVMATINQVLDEDTAVLVVEEMGHKIEVVADDALEQSVLDDYQELQGERAPRAPVVTVMGHVDHGKTSLLDRIRKSRVAAGEAGGITQHIGAYHVDTDNGMVTFIDTPGHAAFTSMRARGAQVTDVVILVVAADDGVMPQTEEAVQHARAADVPMVVAVNKIDKEEADLDRVKTELASREVIPEDWGGDIQFISVSAHTGQGIDELLEAVLLQSELLELTAVHEGQAHGTVIESRLDRGRGPVATVLVQNGLLKVGDAILAGEQVGKVRALVDENGKQIKKAGPSIPVEILGLSGTPDAGDELMVLENERKAREVATFRSERTRDAEHKRQQAQKLDQMFANMEAGEVSNLNIVLKTDVRGTLEALSAALLKLATDEVRVNLIAQGVGGITESDATLASSAGAIVLGFNVRADAGARQVIERNGIELRYYSVIYDIVDDVKAAMSGLLAPELREEIVGVAEVRDVFDSPKFGQIAGCMVVEGIVYRNKKIRVLRDNVVIYEGELESLRRFKDDVNEVRNATECGIGVKNYTDVKSGDKIEVFDVREVARKI